MRTLTADQSVIYGLRHRGVHVRVKIEDGDGTLQDITDFKGHNWLVSVTYSANVDDPVASASISISRAVYDDSLAQLYETSRLNLNAAGSYDPLLDLTRSVVIETAVISADKTAPASADWEEVFRGQIDSVDWSADPIEVSARDGGGLLQDTWIETETDYSNDTTGTAVETVMQSILDDVIGGITLDVPTSPSWNVKAFASQRQSLTDQLSMLAAQIGWTVRYAWDPAGPDFKLTLFTVDRTNTTPDKTFGPDEYFDITQLTLDLASIRNVVTIEYGDKTDLDEEGNPKVKEVTRTNSASITKYGRRWMGIAEASTSHIDTSTEANAMGDACLDDLSDPTADQSVSMPYAHYPELGDLYRYSPNGVHMTANLDLAVIAWSHTISPSQAMTTLTLRSGTPAGSYDSWFDYAAMPGVAELQVAKQPSGVSLTVTEVPAGLYVQFDSGGNAADLQYAVHVGDPGFVPDESDGSTSLYAMGDASGLTIDSNAALNPIGETRDVRAIPIDRWGNRGPIISATNVASVRFGAHFINDLSRIGGSCPGGTFSVSSRGPTLPPDYWNVAIGSFVTDVDVDDGTIYTAGASPKTGTHFLLLKNTTTATSMKSDRILVTAGRRYRFEAEVQASSVASGRVVNLKIEWLDRNGSSITTETVFSGLLGTANTWQRIVAGVQPPPNATQAKLITGKSAVAFYAAADHILLDEFQPTGLETMTSRIAIHDDFIGGTHTNKDIGDLGWVKNDIGSGLTISRPAVSTASYNLWSEAGLIRLQAPADSGSGGSISLGSASSSRLYGTPPFGAEQRIKAYLTNTTQVHVWLGIWDDETTYPDSGLSNSLIGIGVVARAAGAGVNWFGICRNGTSETTVDLGVAADATWRDLGWRATDSGIQFQVAGEDVGAEATTNLPGATAGLIPMCGVVATDANTKDLDLDYFGLAADVRRY